MFFITTFVVTSILSIMSIRRLTIVAFISAFVSNVQAEQDLKEAETRRHLHQYLDIGDLKKIFGVDDKDDVKDYELGEVVRHHERDDVRNVKAILLTIQTTRVKYLMTIKSNRNLVTDGRYKHLGGCVYRGNLIHPTVGQVALSNCHVLHNPEKINRYRGLIVMPGRTIRIHPVPDYLHTRIQGQNASGFHFVTTTTGIPDSRELYQHLRRKRQLSADRLFMELNVAIDDSFRDGLPVGEKFAEVVSILNEAQMLLEKNSLGRLIFLIVKHLGVVDSNLVTPGSGNHMLTYLSTFCTSQRSQQVDASVLITSKTFSNSESIGLSFEGGCCHASERCSVVKLTEQNSGRTVAHEVGHLLGMKHDCVNGCAEQTCDVLGLMTSDYRQRTNNWSNCSKYYFENEFLSNQWGSCLLNYPSNILQDGDDDDDDDVQGRTSLDALCHYTSPRYKAKITDSPPYNRPCSNLYCQRPGSSDQQSVIQPLDGQRCDGGGSDDVMVCKAANCVTVATTTLTTPSTTTPTTTPTTTTPTTTPTTTTPTTTRSPASRADRRAWRRFWRNSSRFLPRVVRRNRNFWFFRRFFKRSVSDVSSRRRSARATPDANCTTDWQMDDSVA